MASDRIELARGITAATEVGELLSAIRDLRSVYEVLTRIRAKMRHCFDDSSGAASIDWSLVETLWGVPPGAVSKGPSSNGAEIFTLIDGATGSLEGLFQTSAGVELTERVG